MVHLSSVASFSFILLFVMPLFSVADCSRHQEGDPLVYYDDLTGSYSLEQMQIKFEQIYANKKRLKGRAFFDEKRKEYVAPLQNGKLVTLPKSFIQRLTVMFSQAMQTDSARFLFLPDMGHAHFFVPIEHWQARYEAISVPTLRPQFYEQILADPELYLLFHTGERLDYQLYKQKDGALVPGRYSQIYWQRNLVIKNDESLQRYILLRKDKTRFNTVTTWDSMYYFGGGFYMHANQSGCFAYQHGNREIRFDFSFLGAPSDPKKRGGYDFRVPFSK